MCKVVLPANDLLEGLWSEGRLRNDSPSRQPPRNFPRAHRLLGPDAGAGLSLFGQIVCCWIDADDLGLHGWRIDLQVGELDKDALMLLSAPVPERSLKFNLIVWNDLNL
jgi:hypothetical protein